MSTLVATEGDSKPRQLPPAGTHIARCVSVIDLGTQLLDYMGEKKQLHKIRVSWELSDELAVFKEENGEQPFLLTKEYTLSLFEKANLRRDLESWRGKSFTEAELKGFDIFKLIGAPCLLTVIHKTTEKGREYANVTAITTMAKGMSCSKQINPRVAYSISDGTNTVYRSFPEWLQKKIQECSEWQEGGDVTEETEPETDEEGEIPF